MKKKEISNSIEKIFTFYHNNKEYIISARDGSEARDKLNSLIKTNDKRNSKA